MVSALMSSAYKICPECQRQSSLDAALCQYCGRKFTTQFAPPPPPSPLQTQAFYSPHATGPYYAPAPGSIGSSHSKLAAGLIAIFLGALGIHGFYLQNTNMGLTFLLVTVLTCGFGGILMGILSLIQGIIMLSSDDADFHRKFVVEKHWF